jgi:hypothetical protein
MHDSSLVEEPDRKNPFDRLTKKAALVVTAGAVLLYFIFDLAGHPVKGRVVSICAAMITTVIWMRWDLRNRVWFWMTIAVLALLHIPAVILIPWNNTNYPGVVLLPGALVDLSLVYVSVVLVERIAPKIEAGRSS